MGIPILIAVLRDDRDDVQLLQGALEALVAATSSSHDTHHPSHDPAAGERGDGSSPYPPHPAGITPAEAQAAAVNAELFARQREHVGLLLGLLEDEPVGVADFYVRYHTVQLLTALLSHCAPKLQEAILATPMSVVRLTELLGERSEIIRNEALLLLAALTRSQGTPGAPGGGSEVQKIAAFEGAFDRVAELLREEGGLDGGTVAQDCIELMNNLLRGNMANQRLFREMGHAAALPRLLAAAVPAPGASASGPGGASGANGGGADDHFSALAGPIPFLSNGASSGFDTADEPGVEFGNALAALAAAGGEALRGGPALPRQKAANMLGLLETFRLLCAPPTSASDPDRATETASRSANQAKLLAAGALDALVGAALRDGGVPSAPVRTAALQALGDLVSELAAGQERLAAAAVRPGPHPGPSGPSGDASGPAADVSVLQAVLRVALYGADAAERTAAGYVIASYCHGNVEGQAMLAASVGPAHHSGGGAPPGLGSSSRPAPASFGQELVEALLAGGAALSGGSGAGGPAGLAGGPSGGASRFAGAGGGGSCGSGGGGQGLLVTCRAAGVLQHLLTGNPAARQRLLLAPIEAPPGPGVPPDFLMPRVVRHLTVALRPPCGDLSRLVVCTLLRLLLVWLQDCPPAVAALLDGAAHVPLLVDIATGRQGPAAASPAPGSAEQGSRSGPTASSGPPSGHLPPLPPYGSAPGGAAAQAAAAQAAPPPAAASGGDPVVCGLGACVLAACMLYGKPPDQHNAAAPSAPPPAAPSDLVLDVVMSRIGLAHFFFRLEDLRRTPAFAAAMADRGPAAKPMTRAAAAAAVAAAEQAAAAAAADGADSAVDGFQLGHDVAALVSGLEEAVRARTMEAFARPAGHRPGGQDGVPASPAEVPGADDRAKVAWALAALGRAARELDELRGRNRALAEDLFRISQQGHGVAPPSAAGSGPGMQGPAAGASAHGAPAAGSCGGLGLGASAADVEARVGLELKASRAEQEAAGLRKQLEMLSARLSQAEVDAHAAREAAASAHLAASKAEADLADLSSAYNNLETHAFATEAQLRNATAALGAAQQAAAAAEKRAQAAEAYAQQAAAAAAAAGGPGAGGVSEAEAARRVEEAVAAAKAEAAAEADEGMTDLLVCLGQEEKKVQVLGEALAAQGVDVEALLATIAPDDEEEEDGQ
ncbi:hypothetical protein HYH03_000521 [Edaphochlamys debaryana]|uniref:Golgin candidate 6 n=1 Tax=Edaphochlamys debaryana TaxID=47281 RepID=A0A835YHN0_9CHLO|nr:hypothetical protein HYH03_000521 [Edaphochlamys debaryana]|eukprot:KAG2502027.1 hypothetical protein HYH03_000521 [Edaphochlamys debaryana]